MAAKVEGMHHLFLFEMKSRFGESKSEIFDQINQSHSKVAALLESIRSSKHEETK